MKNSGQISQSGIGKLTPHSRAQRFKPKYVINGFPKAGTHLAAMFLRPIVEPVAHSQLWGANWAGTFAGNSWTEDWIPDTVTGYKLARLTDGHFILAHMGHTEALELFMYLQGACHILIYRDFRDVAVSQMHHIMNKKGKLSHPGRDLYRPLGGQDEVLSAVIKGIDVYPGVMDRWQHYVPWLDVEWAESISFEEMRSRPHDAARKFIEFGYGRLAQVMDTVITGNADLFKPHFEAMVRSSQDRKRSTTFRKGVSGQWRMTFNKRHIEEFKEADRDGWLVRLGYEKDDNW